MIVARSDWFALRVKLESLFQASFDRSIQSGYLDWRYFDNGQERLLFCIEMADGEPVASYSAFPVDLACNGKEYGTIMSMTTMTHPSWRGKGLFQKLAAQLYIKAEALQIAFVWGFPNANSHPIFNSKLGWSNIYEIPTMTLDITSADARKLSLDAAVNTDDDFFLHYPEPPSDGLIRVHRSKTYLAWRYARNPENIYRNFVLSQGGNVSSYVVTKRFGDGIDLVDIQCPSPEEARVLLSHVAKLSHDEGLKRIYCWAPAHHSLHGILERLGFQNDAPITYFGGRELIASAAPNDWLNYRKWYLQMGDSDVY